MGLFLLPIASSFGQHVEPSDGAKLYFYEVGTLTPKTTYSDPTESIAHTNPVVADARGRFPVIFVSGTLKVVLKDKNDVQIWEEDDIGTEGSAVRILGNFDSSTNGGNYPASGTNGDLYRVTEEFVLAAPSGSHQLYIGDFIVANKANAGPINADWDIIKGRVWLIDEDDMASDSAILAPSQQSVKAFVDNYPMAPLWISGRTYAIGDYVKASDFKIYRALVSQSGNDPSGGSDPTNWLPFGDLLDVLTSTDSTRGLTAAQGKILKDVQDDLVSLVVNATKSVRGLSYLGDQRIILSNSATIPTLNIAFSGGLFTFDDGSGEAIAPAWEKDTSVNWSAGNWNGGLDTGSVATNTWYYCYAIYNPTTEASDYLFTINYGSPVLPSGYTKKRYIGSIKTLTTTILPFTQTGIKFEYKSPFQTRTTTATFPKATATLLNVDVPLAIRVRAILNVQFAATNGSYSYALVFRFFPTDHTDEASSFYNSQLFSARSGGSWAFEGHNVVEVLTDTNGQVYGRVEGSAGQDSDMQFGTAGYFDDNLED
jgi:hypothetical protein